MRKINSLELEDQVISPSPTTSLRPIKQNKKYVSLKKNKISPKYAEVEKGKQVVDTKIETPVMDIPATKPISNIVLQNKRRKMVLSKSSQSSKSKDMNEELDENVDSNPEVYIRRPHTRPSNKLRIKHKLIVNPKLKDLIINVEETPVPKEKAKKMKDKKQKKQKK